MAIEIWQLSRDTAAIADSPFAKCENISSLQQCLRKTTFCFVLDGYKKG